MTSDSITGDSITGDSITGDDIEHDPYCPKRYPSHTFTYSETGDRWTLGPSKYICQCPALTAVRSIEGGNKALQVAYARGRLETSSTESLAHDAEGPTADGVQALRAHLAALRPSGAVVSNDGGWSVVIPGLPVAGSGDDLAGAIDDLVDALREYADDWNARLYDAPNHRENWAVVTLILLSTDGQLANWLFPTEPPST